MLNFLQVLPRFVASFVAEMVAESRQLIDIGVQYFLGGEIRLVPLCSSCQLHPQQMCTLAQLVRSLLGVVLARACDKM